MTSTALRLVPSTLRPAGAAHVTLLALAILNMVPAIEADDSWGVLLIAAGAAVFSLVYAKWSGGKAAPRWLIYVAIFAATGHLVYQMAVPGAEPKVHIVILAHFIIYLCCCKFFELQTYRDVGLVAVISFLLMVISSLVTASPLFALVIVVDLTLGLAWLMAFHAQREMYGVCARRLAAIGPAAAAFNDGDELREAAGSSFTRTAAACAIVLGMVSTLVFICVPRGWKGGLFSRMQGLVPASVTGVDDAVTLTNNDIVEDDSLVLRVRFVRDGVVVTDESFESYLRGLTFDRYVEGRWNRRPTPFPRQIQPAPVDEPMPLMEAVESVEGANYLRQEVWLDSIGQGLLFSVYPPVAFGSPDIKDAQLDRRDLVLKTRSSSRNSAHYTVFTPVRPGGMLGRQLRHLGRARREGWSDIPAAVREFAKSFAEERELDPQDAGTHEALASAMVDFLSSREFEYTLSRGRAGMAAGVDPMEDFLLHNRRGHCEYFASAMTLMCQSIGIPARLVNGYAGGEFNPVGSFFQFRRRDAHAWVEVFLADRGWTTFDPTPANVTQRRRPVASLWADAQRFVDFVRFKWSTLVVSFDSENRAALAEGLRAWLSKLAQGEGEPRSIKHTLATLLWGPDVLEMWQRVFYWLTLVLLVTWIVLVVRVLWILWLMVRAHFPARRNGRSAQVRRFEARFYDRIVSLLENRGHVKPPGATPREFALQLARASADLEEMPAITEWFYEAQFGRRGPDEQRLDRIRHLLLRLRRDPSFGAT